MALQENGRTSDNFWTPKEAAAYIKVNLRTFYKWLRNKKKKVPCRRFGPNCIRIPKDKFIKWADQED